MLSTMLAGAARHSRPVLAAAVVVTSGVVALALLNRVIQAPLTMLISLVMILFAVLNLAAYFRPRQAAFVVDPRTPAFRTPPHEGQLLSVLGAMASSTLLVLATLSINRTNDREPVPLASRLLDAALPVLAAAMVAVVAVSVALAWRGVGTQLRRDGLSDRTGLGTLTVPWEALAPDSPREPPPTARKLALTFARPELVRRRGLLFWSSIQANNLDPVFLAHAIRFYVTNADRRPSIGTQAEYEALLRAVSAPMSAHQP